MKKVNSTNAPDAVGPYSQAVKTGDYIFCSGQLGVNKVTGEMENGLEAQTHQVFKNIKFVLEEEGLTLENVVKTTVFLEDIKNFSKVNEIYSEYFTEPYPARSAFAVKDVPMNGLVEIEVIAELD